MREHDEGYFHFARRMSQKHRRYFLDLPVNQAQMDEFERSVQQSVSDQQAVEAADTLSFDEFLQDYFAQTL